MAGSRSALLAARLELDTTAARPGERLGYAVINTGGIPIMLGEAYELERLAGDGWERAGGPYAFRLWGRRLESGCRYELAAQVPELAQPGRHRLCKRLIADRDPHPGSEGVAAQQMEPTEVTAEFEVMPG